MSSEDKQTQGMNIFEVMLQAMVGVGGAIFFALILLNYAWQSPDGVKAWQIGVSIIFIIISGLLSIVWGDKFLEALGKFLNSSDGL